MTREEKDSAAAAALSAEPREPEDLSPEIAATVERRPGDVVRCTRVGRDGYRCNWWAPELARNYDNPGMGGPVVTTHRVRQSQFLRVTKASGRLVFQSPKVGVN